MQVLSTVEQNAICEICGNRGALDLNGKFVCPDCYANYGSCCLEFGGDDLWQDREDLSRQEPKPTGSRQKS